MPCFVATYLDVVCSYHPTLLCLWLLHLPSAQVTSAESSTRKFMIDADWTVGHGEPLTVSSYEYQHLYLIVSYKDAKCFDIF